MSISVKRTCAENEQFQLSDDSGYTYDYGFRVEYQNTGSKRHTATAIFRVLPARDDAHAQEIGEKLGAFLETIMDISVKGVYPTLMDKPQALFRHQAHVLKEQRRHEKWKKVQHMGGSEFVRV